MIKSTVHQLIPYLLCCAAIVCVTPMYGMINIPLQYPPTIQQLDLQLDVIRTALNTDIIDPSNPNHYASYSIVDYKKRGICFHYAFTKILDINEPLKMLGCYDWFTEVKVLGFFKQIKKPTKNCLALYVNNIQRLIVEHAAQVVNDDPHNIEVESKWGIQDEIVRSGLFSGIPMSYGKHVFFFDLKNQYAKKTFQQNLILPIIQQQITLSQFIQTNLPELQSDLYRLAKKQYPIYYNEFDQNASLHDIASEFLKSVIGVDINQPNDKGKTALMIAAERGHLGLVKLFIDLGADKNIQLNGQTAIKLAYANLHNNVVRFLF